MNFLDVFVEAPGWVAGDDADYVRKANGLAADVTRLNAIRLALRDEVENSVLTDEPGFTRSLENAYRQMWQRWCRSEPKEGRLA